MSHPHDTIEAHRATIRDLEERLEAALRLVRHAYLRGWWQARRLEHQGFNAASIWLTEEGLHKEIAALRGGVVPE